MTARISVSRIHFPVTSLGPGKRIGIWFQGCSIRCPGCISMDTWAQDRGNTTIEEVVSAITPWIPSDRRRHHIRRRAVRSGRRSVRTSGANPVEDRSGHPSVHRISMDDRSAGCSALRLRPLDALVTGPFDIEEKQTLALRGSDNQELHLITDKGRARFASFERLAADHDRSVDVMFDQNGDVWFAGIPARDDFRRLQEFLEEPDRP